MKRVSENNYNMGPLKPQLSLYGKVFVMRPTLVLVKPPTGYETEFLLRVDAGEVGLLALAVILGVLPRFRRLGLKLVAEVPVQQVSVVAVGVCSRASAQLSHRRRHRQRVTTTERRPTWA